MTDKNKCQCSCDECGAECEPFYKTNKTIIDGIDVIKCKYKIQSSENFKTKPYCSILNKFCEDISFVCDKNCQIFEDFKQLARAKEKIEELKQWKEDAKNLFETQTNNADKIINRYKQALIEIEDYVRDNCDFDKSDKLISDTGAYDILEMIPYDIKQRTVNNARKRGEK